jgi:hypothetical protein
MKKDEILKEFVTRSHKKSLKTRKEHYLGNTKVFIKDPLPDNVDISLVLDKVEKTLPRQFIDLVDMIYIGNFDTFKERGVNALYSDGALFITNSQSDNSDLLDDIVHEISHALEESYAREIYGNDRIEIEFVAKRIRLESILRNEGYDTSQQNFSNLDWNSEFDDFLHKEIGYVALNNLSRGLFISAYGATSLREYFANGFEEYYIGDRKYLQTVSPSVYNAISSLEDKMRENA